MPMVYAFDVDETLEVSIGPIPVSHLRTLHDDGHIVGICGNWGVFVQRTQDWSRFISFIGPMLMTKPDFLHQIASYMPADDYVLVGNGPGRSSPDDSALATQAGWRFILEQDFAAGAR